MLNQPVPDFELPATGGKTFALSAAKGAPIVLYFYPKDDTPGCTKEACSFRDADSELAQKGIKVFGVSLDSEESHRQFASKYGLPFTLLSDTDHSVSELYGVYGEQTYGDRKYMGVARKTFLIDEEGRIRKVFDKVNVEAHAGEVMAAFA